MATIYSDVFGSITRRRLQEAKDAATLEVPVRYTPNAEGSRLALRPIIERLLVAQPRARTPLQQIVRGFRKDYRRGVINKTQLRSLTKAASPAESTFSFPAEPKLKARRHSRYNDRLVRRRGK